MSGMRRIGFVFALPICFALFISANAGAQVAGEKLLTEDNAYNPLPSPDGKQIAYVHIGWGENTGWVGFGRASLNSDVKVITVDGSSASKLLAPWYFSSGWTPDGTHLVCYRDGKYALVATDGTFAVKSEIAHQDDLRLRTEWATYSPSLGAVIWSRTLAAREGVIESATQKVVSENIYGRERFVPSPDGRYLAVFHGHLDIYDLQTKEWTDLGRVTIHPDTNWDYIMPDWNPWFADSSHLVFVRYSELIVTTPDGKNKTKIPITGTAGLPTASPDGSALAYVTFEPTAEKSRPDLQFWGGTTLWVVANSEDAIPRPITTKNPDEVYSLKWLDNHSLVFDRVADVPFYEQARIWTVPVSP